MLLLGSDVITLKQEFGKNWLKIFYHNCNNDEWFTDLKDFYHINEATRFSILELITSDFKFEERYEFLLQYPEVPGEYIYWGQKKFPLDANQSINPSVEHSCDPPFHCSWIGENWAGLSISATQEETFVDGSYDSSHWWYTIGAKKTYHDYTRKFPGPPQNRVSEVFLWIRVPFNILRKLRILTCFPKHYHFNLKINFLFIVLSS